MSKQDVTQFCEIYKDLYKCLVFSRISNFEIGFSLRQFVFLNNLYCYFLTTFIVTHNKPYIVQVKGFYYLIFLINKYSTLIFSLHFKLKRIRFALWSTKFSIKHISTFTTFLSRMLRFLVSHSYQRKLGEAQYVALQHKITYN